MNRLHLRGLRYALRERGGGAPLLALHGFTGAGDTWAAFARRWPGTRLLAPDLLGHGRSDAPSNPRRYAMHETVADLVALLDALGIPSCALLGYSMGGRIALRLARAHPGRVHTLILESASPGIAAAPERAARRAADAALADRLEREGIASFVAAWEALPLWASQAALPAPLRDRLRRQRLAQRPNGLANSLRGICAGADPPVLNTLTRYPGPLTIVTGALDAKYTALGRTMAAAHPRARLHVVAGAGHAVHLDAPAPFAHIVRAALQEGGA